MVYLLIRNSFAESYEDGVGVSKMEITTSGGTKNVQTQEAEYLKGGKL